MIPGRIPCYHCKERPVDEDARVPYCPECTPEMSLLQIGLSWAINGSCFACMGDGANPPCELCGKAK